MGLKKDVFGHYIFLRKLVIRIFGYITYFRFNTKNIPKISGAEYFKDLPKENVLFISNHQTYFADGAFMFHVVYSAIDGYPNLLRLKSILKCRLTAFYYVAAEEPMKFGILPKILALSDAIPIKRTVR